MLISRDLYSLPYDPYANKPLYHYKEGQANIFRFNKVILRVINKTSYNLSKMIFMLKLSLLMFYDYNVLFSLFINYFSNKIASVTLLPE